jgi:hypothetical protein
MEVSRVFFLKHLGLGDSHAGDKVLEFTAPYRLRDCHLNSDVCLSRGG